MYINTSADSLRVDFESEKSKSEKCIKLRPMQLEKSAPVLLEVHLNDFFLKMIYILSWNIKD